MTLLKESHVFVSNNSIIFIYASYIHAHIRLLLSQLNTNPLSKRMLIQLVYV